jgi:hypothetical protein
MITSPLNKTSPPLIPLSTSVERRKTGGEVKNCRESDLSDPKIAQKEKH